MHGLQWDCSFPRSPHGEARYIDAGYLESVVEMRNGYKIFMEKPEGTRPLQVKGREGVE
jgi:hypothetical protein